MINNSLPRSTNHAEDLTSYEALRIREAAQAKSGSREEMISALAAARVRIWEIADRAPKSEGARIRGLTRTLDHMQEALGDPFWEIPEAPVDLQD